MSELIPDSLRSRYRAVLDKQLAHVTTTLCRVSWDNRQLDAILLNTLGDCLMVLEAAAFVARYVREDMTLKHAVRPAKVSEALLDQVANDLANATHRHGQIFYRQVGPLHVVGTVIPEHGVKDVSIAGYAAVCFATVPDDEQDRDLMIAFHGQCTAALLWQVLQQRVRVFLPVAPRLAEAYWMSARNRGDGDLRTPPWESRGKEAIRTVTLGFDLRKSTFCMDNADDPKKFAFWLDDMVQILMRIAHRYGGIFDKFTGDGALVHFLVQEPNGTNAVTHAVLCAVAMQKAINEHLARLRGFLRLDSEVIGGGIGVDIADARWMLDERDNPITVGRGVVYACRLMDSSKARKVRLTNIAYQDLDDEKLKRLFVATRFTSKEFGPDLELNVWELENAVDVPLPAADERAVADICHEVWRRRPS